MKPIISFIAIYLILVACLLILGACSPVTYFTTYKGGADPLYDYKGKTSIGLTPIFYMSKGIVTELEEKEMFGVVKRHLEKRGFSVMVLTREDLVFSGDSMYPRQDLPNMPDFTMSIHFWGKYAGDVNVPSEYLKMSDWSGGKGSTYSGGHGEYAVPTYSLVFGARMWANPPKFMTLVWDCEISKGSSKNDLSQKIDGMIEELFYQKKFPQVKK